jgi:hypothetical protein
LIDAKSPLDRREITAGVDIMRRICNLVGIAAAASVIAVPVGLWATISSAQADPVSEAICAAQAVATPSSGGGVIVAPGCVPGLVPILNQTFEG